MIAIFYTSLALVAASNMLLVDAELAPSCWRATNASAVRTAEAPSDPDFHKQQEWIAQAHKAWSDGRKLAFELKTEPARRKLEEALVLIGRGAPALDDFTDYARVLIDLGAVLFDGRQDEAASNAFKSALVLELAKADPQQYPPDVFRRIQRVEAAILRSPRSSVTLSGRPEGAAIYWDGRYVGQLPTSIRDVLPGDHWLTALAPGRKRFSTQVTVSKKAERVDVFMQAYDENTPPERLAIAAAQHTGELTEIEQHALAEVSRGKNVVVVAAQDARSHGACNVRYRVVRQGVAGPRLDAGSLLDVDRLWREAAPEPASTPTLVKPTPPTVAARVHPALALLPLGVGQLIEQRPVAGTLLLTTQLGLLATNIATYYVAQHNRQPDGTYNNAAQTRVLEVVSNAAVAALIIDVIAGAVDGLLQR